MIDMEKYEANKEFISANVFKIQRINERRFVYDKKVTIEILKDGLLVFSKKGKKFEPRYITKTEISINLRHFLSLQVNLEKELIEKIHIFGRINR